MIEKKYISSTNKELIGIVKEIYDDIYSRFREQYIVVFLCGGASNSRHISLRDKVRVLLENEKRSLYNKPLKIFYPEDLLIEVLNKTKDADLLSYEQFLADNSHIISVICESAGSLVELGAFTNNNQTVDKVIAAVDKKRVKDKSFIMLGPVRYLKKRSKNNVVEYGQNIEDFARQLSKAIREKNKRNGEKKIRITTIIGMHYFIHLLLYFFKRLSSIEMVDIIKCISEGEGINYDNFDVLFKAALKLLFQDKKIVKITENNYSFYELTNEGCKSIKYMINDCTGTGLSDYIRVELMYYEFYKSPHS